MRGPILPISCNLLALTPISPFRPRHWRGALLPAASKIRFEIIESAKRPVSAVADFNEIRDVQIVDIVEDRSREINLLFDEEKSFDDKIVAEQFVF